MQFIIFSSNISTTVLFPTVITLPVISLIGLLIIWLKDDEGIDALDTGTNTDNGYRKERRKEEGESKVAAICRLILIR